MGRVWAARDELLTRDVAVKELVPPAGLSAPELRTLRERAIREARAIAMLDQPNVVRIFDVVFEGDDPWIIMELVPSRSLFDTVRDDGPMAPDRVAHIGLGVLAALRAAHRAGLLHRDVKPGNVLLAHDGRVVLTDFGLATADGDASMTGTGVVLGSPQYLAPERALDGEVGPAADLWSLGATLYAAVEGRPPYVRSSPMATLAALATELPAAPERAGALRHVLTALLQRDPADRADAETARRLLLAASVPGSPLPPNAPIYPEPTFATPHPTPASRPAGPAPASRPAGAVSAPRPAGHVRASRPAGPALTPGSGNRFPATDGPGPAAGNPVPGVGAAVAGRMPGGGFAGSAPVRPVSGWGPPDPAVGRSALPNRAPAGSALPDRAAAGSTLPSGAPGDAAAAGPASGKPGLAAGVPAAVRRILWQLFRSR